MKKATIKLTVILALTSSYSLPASAQNDAYQAMVARTVNELGAAGYAKCAAATITMLALRARGDNLGRFTPNVDPMVNFMSAVRSSLLSKGNPVSSLDKLITYSSQVIMSSSDPVLTAMKDFDKCYNDAVAAPAPAPAPAAAAPARVPAPSVDNSPFTPSFDCTKASNGQERMVCADRELAKLDVELSQAYLRARDRATDKDTLRKTQLEWVKQGFRACSDKSCLVSSYTKRIAELQR